MYDQMLVNFFNGLKNYLVLSNPLNQSENTTYNENSLRLYQLIERSNENICNH